MHLVYPHELCIIIVFDLSWDDCNAQEKIRNKSFAKLQGDKQGALWSR